MMHSFMSLTFGTTQLLDWDASNLIHAKGAHKYTLADFGLDEQQINRDFAGYIALLNQLFSQGEGQSSTNREF